MISDSWRTGVSSTMKYFAEHLTIGDYYMEQNGKTEKVPAVWAGLGAKRLGLSGEVTKEQFEHLTKNVNPQDGERLTLRRNDDSNRRTWWDVAISPPKDVSVYAALAPEETKKAIHDLHFQTSLKAAKMMESFLGTRVRDGGKKESKIGNTEAVVAAVLHDTARPVDGVPDPHLHTHLLFANAVFDKDREQWLALENSGVLQAKKFVRQYYYSELAKGLKEMGIQTETRENQNDFVISGMSRELVEKFSRRHEQVVDRANAKMGMGMGDFNAAKNLSTVEAREKKVHLTDAELLTSWQELAGKKELKKLASLREGFAKGKNLVNSNFQHLDLNAAVAYAKEHAFENETVIDKHKFYETVLQAGRGNFSYVEMVKHVRNDLEIVADKKKMTTRNAIQQERSLRRMVNEGMGILNPSRKDGVQVPDSPQGESWRYSKEQKKVIGAVLDNRDFVQAINGVAGAGKTTILKEIQNLSKREILTLAPSGQATEILRQEGFSNAETLQQILVNEKLHQSLREKLLVIDEAGMISNKDMQETLKLAKKYDCKVLLVGDIKQIQSVGSGDAFRILQFESKMQTLQVKETRRQKTKEYKDAVGSFRESCEKKHYAIAWEKFEKMNAIRLTRNDEKDLRDAQLSHLVNEGMRKFPSRKDGVQVPNSPQGESWRYSKEQKKVIWTVLNNRDFVQAINGVTGVGKTIILKEIQNLSKRKIVPLATSGQAVEALKKEGFSNAETLQQILVNEKLHELLREKLLVIHEAEMISNKDMKKTLNLAKKYDCKVLLVGDIKQIQSVGNDDAFRILQSKSKMKTLQMKESPPQKTKEYKNAIDSFQKSSEKFDNMNAIHVIENDESHLRQAQMLKDVEAEFKKDENLLIVARKWETIHAMNQKIREQKIAKNELGEIPCNRTCYEPIHFTAVQKSRGAAYEVGQKIELLRNVEGLGVKNSQFTIAKVKDGKILVANEKGELAKFSAREHGASVTVYKERKLEFRKGDLVLIKQNMKHAKNGNRAKITDIEKDGTIRAKLIGEKEKEIIIPADFKHFLHGYAVTAHASQGATVDSVAVIGDNMTKEQFYVAATRGKHKLQVFTTDYEKMKNSVAVTSERKSGFEFLREIRKEKNKEIFGEKQTPSKPKTKEEQNLPIELHNRKQEQTKKQSRRIRIR